MNDIKNFSNVENQLLLELEHILVNHRYNCSSIENISTSNYTYMYRIKNALLKSKVEKKRIAVLQTIINSINIKIEKGMLFKEIFEPLPAIIIDELKKYSKKPKTIIEDNKNTTNGNDYNKRIENSIKNIIDQIIVKINGYTRNDLIKLETEYNNYIKTTTSAYGIEKASVEVLGSLYAGLIGCTRKNFEKDLYDNYRIKLKKSDKLSNKMSNELLTYRVAALIYTNVLCNKRSKIIKNDIENKNNYRAYAKLKKDIYFLGKTVREKYQDDYYISPKEEIIKNYINGQMSFEGLMKKRDEIMKKNVKVRK